MRDLELLYEIGSLRHVQRGWRQQLGTDCENDLEHTIRVVWIALILARREGVGNEEKIMKMAMVHDLAETRIQDHSHLQKMYIESDESRAVHDTLAGTGVSDLETLLMEYERRDSIEAKIVKDADNLDVDLELKELEEKGHKLVSKWQETRRQVRDEKLYTEAAKKMWDEIQTSDPSSWHLTANTWLKKPEAGK